MKMYHLGIYRERWYRPNRASAQFDQDILCTLTDIAEYIDEEQDPYRVVRLRWLRWIFIVRPEDIFSHGTSQREREGERERESIEVI